MTESEAYDHLVKANPAQLDAVVARLNLRREFISPHPAPTATRSNEIITLVRQGGSDAWADFEKVLLDVIPLPVPDYWFFLSHSHWDQDEWLERFYEELVAEVRRQKQLSDKVVGFFRKDKKEPTEDWDRASAEALKTAKVFLWLYSQKYFCSKYCGKEWKVFRSRHEGPGLPPPLMIPVYWDPPEKLPTALPRAIEEIDYQKEQFGASYAKHGLRCLMKLENKYRGEYRNFLEKLAKQIIESAEKHPLPELSTVPPFQEVTSAFDGPWMQGKLTAPGPGRGGPRVAKFVFVAGSMRELTGHRRNIDWYGPEGGRDWKPYLPLAEGDVGLLAQGIAFKGGFHYETVPLDDQFVERLQEAQRNNHIVLILVDAWTVRLPTYSDRTRAYDDQSFRHCAVFIPWNYKDDETEQERRQLEEDVKRAFPNKDAKNPQLFRDAIDSDTKLRNQLRTTLNKIWKQITETGDPKYIEGKDKSSLPVLPVPPSGDAVQ